MMTCWSNSINGDIGMTGTPCLPFVICDLYNVTSGETCMKSRVTPCSRSITSTLHHNVREVTRGMSNSSVHRIYDDKYCKLSKNCED